MHGTVTVDETLCKGCALCIPVCPKGLMRVADDRFNARGVHPAELIDPANACTGCQLCATMCPEAAITVYRAAKVA
ncbi:MAG: 4Fe-4S dicluster domain-containing protein [Trueperaceae bacterium]|jgi:2-oxoglutarate ferredoxin oxidoreductase subunit delta|nr:MAG: 4Fe-4S dicluster domain-containing protein [Trueperaceae bacterium]